MNDKKPVIRDSEFEAEIDAMKASDDGSVTITVRQNGIKHSPDAQFAIERWETQRAGNGRLSCAHNDDELIRIFTVEAEMFRDELKEQFDWCDFYVQTPLRELQPTDCERRVRLRIECFPPCSKAEQLISQVQERYLPWTGVDNITHFDFAKYRALQAVDKFKRDFPGFKFSIKAEYQG